MLADRLGRLLLALVVVLAVVPFGTIEAKPGDRNPAKSERRDRGEERKRGDEPASLEGVRVVETGAIRQTGRRSDLKGDSYIVRLKDGGRSTEAASLELTSQPGVIPTHVYRYVFAGFAARLTPEARRRLQRDPRVASIERDGEWRAFAQTLPIGVNRIEADVNPLAKIDGVDQRVNVDVAVIDSGIDTTHPDLNVWAVADCTGEVGPDGKPYVLDRTGHGTHVAGTIGALDNGIGVVGVAPGARIWSIRAASTGTFPLSNIICAYDTVARYARDQGDGLGTIEVVNMSFGGQSRATGCSQNAVHAALCRVVGAGVTAVAAAGNDTKDAGGYAPANYPEVIAVSALDDRDGVAAGDRLATFSNFGSVVDIAAPGVGIWSTIPRYLTANGCDGLLGCGYGAKQGTSMASPHVAGGAALVKAANPSFTPAQVKQALQDRREPLALPGDPDGIVEGVLNVATVGG